MPPTPPKKGGPNWARISRNLSFWILVILIPVAFLQYKGGAADSGEKIIYSQFQQQLDADNIARVVVIGEQSVKGDFRTPVRLGAANKTTTKFETTLPIANWESEMERLRAQMTAMVATCERRTDVFRYAWFTGRWANDVHHTSLLGAKGELTELGRHYLSLPYGG